MDHSPVTNLANSVVKRHWSSFAAELVLVVVGILIALYIDSWVDERKDRELEKSYLEALLVDLDAIDEAISLKLEYEEAFLRAAESAYVAVQGRGAGYGVEDLARWVSTLTVRNTLWIDSPAYSDLINTGNLDLITDRGFRTSLLRYFDDVERLELVMDKNNLEFVDRGFMPYARSQGFELGRYDLPSLPDAYNEQYASLSAKTTKRALSRMNDADWEQLEVQLHWRAVTAASFIRMSKSANEATQTMRAEIQAYLESR